MRALIFLRYVLKEFPFLLLGTSLILILTGLLETLSLFVIAPIIDMLMSTDLQGASPITRKITEIMASIGIPVTLGALFSILILLNFFKAGVQILSAYLILKIKYALSRELIVETFNDFFQARWFFFSSSQQGKLLNTFIREIGVVGDAFSGMARFAAALLQLSVFLIVPFLISWKVMSCSMSVALFLAMPFMFLGNISHRLGAQNTATANKLSIIIQESLSSAKVILGFANQKKCSDNVDRSFNAHVQATIKSQTFGAAVGQMHSPMGILGVAATFFAAKWFSVPVSETAILIISFMKIIPSVGQITTQKNLMDNSFPSYEQVMNLRVRAKELQQVTGEKKFTGFEEIVLNDISFAYPSHEPVLMNINFRIPKGRMIAIVGESGAGKSTLIDMIMGFNEPDSGKLLIDGNSLWDYDINSYRQKIGYVPQESILFNMSIAENLRWANGNSSDEDLYSVCKLANADEFIKDFPEGYDTLVGDRGVRLSGGQIQRIALARAIIRKPDILILDEATSSLDTHSERSIQKAIEKLSHETTIIVIAHRLSTIVHADVIYVLKEGRIVEEGNYEYLLKKEGQFCKMVSSQKFGGMEASNPNENAVS